MKTDLAQVAEQVIMTSVKAGAQDAEAYIIDSKDLTIEVANSKVETLKLAEEQGLGIRIINDQKVGFAFTADLSQKAINKAVEQAIANSHKTHGDEANRVPKVDQGYPNLDIFDPEIRKAEIEAKIQIAKEIEAVARAYDPRVKITEGCSYVDSEYNVYIANSRGVLGSYRGSYCGAYGFLVAEENGDNQTGFSVQYGLRLKDLDAKAIGEEAAANAVQMLGAKTINTQRATVVLDPRIVTNFLGVLAPALSGEAVQKGKSLFAGKLGTKVATDLITIIDDGALAGGIMSSPFDGEGVPTGETVLIKDGVLQGFLHNTYSAAKDGVESTGNGVRSSYKSTPEISTTNFYLKPGKIKREDLLAGVKQGLYVTEVMGMHTANPISGDFSVGAAGIWIEDGKFAYPVRGIAIAGNILEVFSNVDKVASDLRFFGGKGAPTVSINAMTISGS